MPSESETPSFLVHNGSLRSSEEEVLRLDDAAIVRGAGLFESIASYGGVPFALDEHLERLARGAEFLGLNLPARDALESAISSVLGANGLADKDKARIRITITGGSPEQGNSQWFVEATLPPPHPTTASVVTVPFVRNERGALSGCKSINYGENVVAMRLAADAGADEALFGNTRGSLCEGTWSNVFVRQRGKWRTPPLSSGCLPGVTRHFVLEIAANTGPEIENTELSMTELEHIDAAFLTSSLREIQPVTSIDGRPLEGAAPEISTWQEAFRRFVKGP